MHQDRTNRRPQDGFTLLELIVVMTVILILVGFGLPALSLISRRTGPDYPLQVIERIHRMQQCNARQFGSAGVIYGYHISDANGVRPFVAFSRADQQQFAANSPTKYYVSGGNGVNASPIDMSGSNAETVLAEINIGGQTQLSQEDQANSVGINLRTWKLTPMKSIVYTFGETNDLTISFEPRTGLCWSGKLTTTEQMGACKAIDGKWVHYLATTTQAGSWSDKSQYVPRYIMEFNRSGHLRISGFRPR